MYSTCPWGLAMSLDWTFHSAEPDNRSISYSSAPAPGCASTRPMSLSATLPSTQALKSPGCGRSSLSFLEAKESQRGWHIPLLPHPGRATPTGWMDVSFSEGPWPCLGLASSTNLLAFLKSRRVPMAPGCWKPPKCHPGAAARGRQTPLCQKNI